MSNRVIDAHGTGHEVPWPRLVGVRFAPAQRLSSAPPSPRRRAASASASFASRAAASQLSPRPSASKQVDHSFSWAFR